MTKKINPGKLKKGDIILTGVDKFKDSWPIKLGNIFHGRWNAIKWTHVAMSIGGFDIVESMPDPGVTIRNIQTEYIDKTIDILVLRCKALGQKQIDEVADYCVSKQKASSRYDKGALSYFVLHFLFPTTLGRLIDTNIIWHTFFEKHINDEDSYFCSELIAEGFREVGFNFKKSLKPWQIMPVDFYNLKFFDTIDDVWS